MEKLIDLHTHTNFSDGQYSPNELIKKAIANNVGVLAITDHDTIAGLEYIDRSDFENQIKIINGIELSIKVDKGAMHILGLGIDYKNELLNQVTKELKKKSIRATFAIIDRIKKDYNIIFNEQDLETLLKANRNIGRPDVAKLCIKYGYAKSVGEAFKKYLIDAYNKTRSVGKGLRYDEAIDLILKSGGIPVLAHPKTLDLDKKDFLICLRKLISCGLKGIEVYHSTFLPEDIEYYTNIAREYNLLISGGSDYHGPEIKPDISLGTGKNNNLRIKKLSILDKL